MSDSSLIARRLVGSELALFASPGYLERSGTPRSIEELREHDCFALSGSPLPGRWPLDGPDGVVEVAFSSWLSVNEFGFLRAAIAAGIGIGLLETSVAHAQQSEAPLAHVLPEYVLRGGGLFAVYPSSHHLSPKVRVFLAFVEDRLKREGFGWSPARRPP